MPASSGCAARMQLFCAFRRKKHNYDIPQAGHVPRCDQQWHEALSTKSRMFLALAPTLQSSCCRMFASHPCLFVKIVVAWQHPQVLEAPGFCKLCNHEHRQLFRPILVCTEQCQQALLTVFSIVTAVTLEGPYLFRLHMVEDAALISVKNVTRFI